MSPLRARAVDDAVVAPGAGVDLGGWRQRPFAAKEFAQPRLAEVEEPRWVEGSLGRARLVGKGDRSEEVEYGALKEWPRFGWGGDTPGGEVFEGEVLPGLSKAAVERVAPGGEERRVDAKELDGEGEGVSGPPAELVDRTLRAVPELFVPFGVKRGAVEGPFEEGFEDDHGVRAPRGLLGFDFKVNLKPDEPRDVARSEGHVARLGSKAVFGVFEAGSQLADELAVELGRFDRGGKEGVDGISY